jgi:hypothetical protein
MDELLRQALFRATAALLNMERRFDTVIAQLSLLTGEKVLDDLEMRAFVKEAVNNRHFDEEDDEEE